LTFQNIKVAYVQLHTGFVKPNPETLGGTMRLRLGMW